MKTFALILRKSAEYHFQGQEASPRVRLKGAIVADASLENAAFYIAHRMADLYFGSMPRNVEWLNSRSHKKAGPTTTRKTKLDISHSIKNHPSISSSKPK